MYTEEHRFKEVAHEIENWWKSPRWENVYRSYTASQVAALRPSIKVEYASNHLSKKLWGLLTEARDAQNFIHTYGALDPVQVANLAKYLKGIYVSGWQCSSTASTTNHPGPDFADYPYDTVPNKVDQLFKALMFHDRRQNEARSRMTHDMRQRTPKVDYMVPMIADADAGFGGTTSVMKLVQLFIEAGAAGVHIEDQRAGTKKCGHMAGKVIVSCREHVQRLVAARLQADIMGTDLIVLARTDALGARMIDSNADPVDQPWILGIVDPKKPEHLVTFPVAGAEAIKRTFKSPELEAKLHEWNRATSGPITLNDAHELARKLGFTFYFDWDSPRTSEGFYLTNGSVEYCVARGKEFLKVADMIWMETPKPNYEVAKRFADLMKVHHPRKFLSYNLSPSFNWSGAGISDKEIGSFCDDIGKLGYVWQFITLAGFHMDSLVSEKFSKDFAKRKMIAYVERVQRKEVKHNVDQLTHQKWSGAELIDSQTTLVDSEGSLASSSGDSTEHQFAGDHHPKPKL